MTETTTPARWRVERSFSHDGCAPEFISSRGESIRQDEDEDSEEKIVRVLDALEAKAAQAERRAFDKAGELGMERAFRADAEHRLDVAEARANQLAEDSSIAESGRLKAEAQAECYRQSLLTIKSRAGRIVEDTQGKDWFSQNAYAVADSALREGEQK